MEEVIDQGTFWFYGPVWVVNHHSRITNHEDGFPVLSDEKGVVRVEGERTGKAILIFTDRDLGERFVAAMKPGLAVATFPSNEHFAAFLQRAKAGGETHVGVDPGPRSVRFFSIDRILAAIAGRG